MSTVLFRSSLILSLACAATSPPASDSVFQQCFGMSLPGDSERQLDLNGYVTSIHVVDSVIVTGCAGFGQACYDGRIAWHHARDGTLVDELRLGENSKLAKEQGIYSSSPRVATVLDRDRVLVNLICGPLFPESNEGGSYTGNVVLYDRSRGILRNLTQITRDDRYIRGIEWFAEQGLLLCLESDVGGNAMPTPDRASETPVLLDVVSRARRVEMESHPEILAWYERYQETTVIPAAVHEYPFTGGFDLLWSNATIRLSNAAAGIDLELCRGSVVTVDLARRHFTYQVEEVKEAEPRRFAVLYLDRFVDP